MDGTDRNLEIPTRGLVPQPIKNFTAAGAGTQKPLGMLGDSLAGGREARDEAASLTHGYPIAPNMHTNTGTPWLLPLLAQSTNAFSRRPWL